MLPCKHTLAIARTAVSTFHLFESYKLDEKDSAAHLMRQFWFSTFLSMAWELHGNCFL